MGNNVCLIYAWYYADLKNTMETLGMAQEY